MPLPLVPFEHYLLTDDRPDYPMTIFVKLHFTGVLDRPSFERALADTVARQPLLRAFIRESRPGRWEWIDQSNSQAFLSWNRLGVAWDFPQGRQLDLRREIGIRVWIRHDDERSEMLLQVHHACCDGLGVMQILEDFMLAYDGQRRPGVVVNFREQDNGLVARRGKFGLSPLRLLLRLPQELLGLIGALEFMAHRPLPVAIPAAPSGANKLSHDEFPASVSHRFGPEEIRVLRNVAKTHEATLNDVLIRDLFLALGDWTDEHEPANRGQVLRIMVPVNLRSDEDKRAPAANIMSMVNLDRRPSKFGTPRSLLRGLSWEMWAIRKFRLGLTLIHLARLLRKVRGNLAALLPDTRCLATCVLSNLGRIPSGAALPRTKGRNLVGDVVLENIEGLAPLRPFTRVAFVVLFYGGHMSLTMTYDPGQLAPDDARQLLSTLVSRIDRTLSEGEATPARAALTAGS